MMLVIMMLIASNTENDDCHHEMIACIACWSTSLYAALAALIERRIILSLGAAGLLPSNILLMGAVSSRSIEGDSRSWVRNLR